MSTAPHPPPPQPSTPPSTCPPLPPLPGPPSFSPLRPSPVYRPPTNQPHPRTSLPQPLLPSAPPRVGQVPLGTVSYPRVAPPARVVANLVRTRYGQCCSSSSCSRTPMCNNFLPATNPAKAPVGGCLRLGWTSWLTAIFGRGCWRPTRAPP